MKALRTIRRLRYPLLFLIGAPGYYLLEVLWRGHSHPTMALCGGICLCALGGVDELLADRPIYVRAATGALVITAVEFTAGYILNIRMGLGIWDYSAQPFNLLGQICLVFSLLWYMLCVPVCAAVRGLTRLIDHRIAAGTV